jgi:NADH dehydrogenase
MESSMSVRNVTIFGGSGFLGRHLVRQLAQRGWTMRIAVRRPENAGFLKPMGSVGQIVPVAANLRNADSVAAAVAGADAVVNLVGILFEGGRQSFAAIHETGAETVAAAARDAGVKALLHVSALGANTESLSAYARSKARGEATVREIFPEATVFRPAIVIGPEDDFFNRFARLARISPVLPLIGGGTTQFQPVYVGDVAAAISAALVDPKARGRVFEIGGPAVYSFRQLMEMLLETVDRPRLLVPLPFPVARFMAFFLERFPTPMLTRDQLALLKTDNVVGEEAATLADLGITPRPIETVIPAYLSHFRQQIPVGRAGVTRRPLI